MLLISIIALVIIAGAVFYMYKSSKAVEVVLENKDLTDEIVEATASVSKSIKQVEKMAAKIDETLAAVNEEISPVTEAVAVKPAKKKRRYYPKKK
jgi:septal ring factor EnvC (AmiA/AmiB activator)